MKASVLGLWAATAALGGSSIYLWNQLQSERVHAAELEARSADLNTRISELERARGEFEQRQFASAHTSGKPAEGGPGSSPPLAAGAIVNETSAPGMSPWTVRSPPARSEAMRKMMRVQIRAHNKRLYTDVGSALGLSRDQADKLIDLLTDQQSFGIEPFREGKEAEDFQNAWAERQRTLQSEIALLLGDDKVASLQEYQKSLPARQELEMLTRQLEGYDEPISDAQRKQLLKAMVDERDRIPAPEYVDGTDPEDFHKTRMAWEEDYNDRVASQARNILDSGQITAYTEYQQAQKDMRAQFGTLMPAGPRRAIRTFKGGEVAFSSGAPAGGAIMAAEAVFIAVPPEPDPKK